MKKCIEENCEIHETGLCIKGLPNVECDNFISEDTLIQDEEEIEIEESEDFEDLEESNEVETNEIGDSENDDISLYSGKKLNVSEANKIAKSGPTQLVLLAGLPDAGKTTLIVSLMHSFQTLSSVSNFIFAGSKTLLAFDELAFPASISSENLFATTTRTPVGEHLFMHLKLANSESVNDHKHVLFTDISGEHFRSLRDSTDQCEKFHLGNRADHFVLFLDASKLCCISERAIIKSSTIGILKGLISAGGLNKDCNIQIVFSKWDLFISDSTNNAFLDSVKGTILNTFGSTYKIDFFEIAARPNNNNNFNQGHGLDLLLRAWMSPQPNDNSYDVIESLISDREYLNFKFNK